MTDLVCLTAARGTGKTTLAAALAESRGLVHARVSVWLSDVVRAEGVEPTPDALRAAGEAAAADPDRLVAEVLAHAGWRAGRGLVFDSVRHASVLRSLRVALSPETVLHVGLVADNRVRGSRLALRGDLADVAGSEGHSTEAEVTSLVLRADIRVDASETGRRQEREVVRGLDRLRRL